MAAELANGAAPDDACEHRVWDLLTRNFQWDIPSDHPVQVYDKAGALSGPVRLQIFEIAVTTILAQLKPEYAWRVTPNRPDSGLDFIGINRFLNDHELGIAAAITVGGQCKKRTTVNDILGELAGSLVRMADTVSPTFFVVALSARLTRQRVEQASEMLERQLQRQCHILDRAQIEGLFGDHLEAVTEILDKGLRKSEAKEVLSYFEARRGLPLTPRVTSTPLPRILAGVPFRVDLKVHWTRASDPAARLWWQPGPDAEKGEVMLIGPIGADRPAGSTLASERIGDDPLSANCTIELITYVVGDVDLGEVFVGNIEDGADSAESLALGCAQVIETMRPRFFDRPYRAGLERLSRLYDQVFAGGVASVGVVGAGGSGKSRMCEEFALEKRRRGCSVVTAKHAKTHEEPQRILAELLTGLAIDGRFSGDPADEVIATIEHYDKSLADNAAPAIRSTFGSASDASANITEQSILSALVLLLVARSRRTPLIIHLQDLHWCSAEVLSLLDRLLRQLGQLRAGDTRGSGEAGVLFIFEGRVRETDDSGEERWSSAPFEAFLARTESATIRCSSFTAEDGLAFTRLLFEDRHNAHRLLADDLLGLQEDLATRICHAAGGNPFHTLEQVRLLRERGVIGQNPKTGLLYMIRPEPTGSTLPESVFAAIQLRWQYMRKRTPDLALLVWGSALLDDRLAAPLFRRLWRELAPDVSIRDIDATDMLWTGDIASHEVVFRHENYFESIRRFTVSEADRRRVVGAYCAWFSELESPGPADQFGWARAILELSSPDHNRAGALLASALESAQRSGNPRLARRILAFHLDLIWDMDEKSSLKLTEFVSHCDEESDLCRELLGTDREQAARRIRRLRHRIESHLKAVGDGISAAAREGLLRRLLTTEALQAQLYFNDRRPVESAEMAGRVVASVRAQRSRASQNRGSWDQLEMEALYTQSCGQVISGEFGSAVQSSAAAAQIAERSESPLARKVISTYGTMLLSEDPERGESVLRECLERWVDDGTSDASLVHVHLSMSLVLQAYRCPPESEERRSMLDEAGERMTRIHDSCRRLGLYADAAAAAVVRGVVSGISGEGDEPAWFAQGVAAAVRGQQMETLWRSHINLATALCQKEGLVSPTACDHAVAALEIMEDTLTVYSEPELSPRFRMLRIGMAAAASMLLANGDDGGRTVLERYPTLRSHFSDPEAGVLAPYDGGPRHYQWLRVDNVDYVLY